MRNLRAGLGLLLAGGALWGQYLISTVAGGGGMPITPSPAAAMRVPPPAGVAVDSAGNVYFASGNYIFKIDSSGTLTTVAGTGKAGYSGDGGQATSARIHFPQGVAIDGAGNLLIADTYNNVIRRVTAGGVITTVAGTGMAGYAGDGSSATHAQLSQPWDVAVDSGGNLYIADTGNSVVRRVAANGVITTVAGNGQKGYLGDNGPAIAAEMSYPQSVTPDAAGNLYIADTGNARIRRVTNGIITTFAGTGTAGFSGDGGPATAAQIDQPWAAALGGDGSLYIADANNYVIRRVAPNGIITTVAGVPDVFGYSGDGGPATGAELDWPASVAVDSSGGLYISDVYNCRIRRVAAGGTISTIAGAGTWGFAGDGGPATQAEFYTPWGAALDSAGNLYIADSENRVVRRVTPNGTVTTVAGTPLVDGNSGDGGPATTARMGRISGVAVDTGGNLYIVDPDYSVVRKVAPNGIISTAAGTGTAGYSGDGGPAAQAQLNQPSGIAVDGAGNLYIADTFNDRIREVTNGVISTVAGAGVEGYSYDPGPAVLAWLDTPYGVAVDASGNLYIADGYNSVIREVTTDGTIWTIAGIGQYPGSAGDGGPATMAQLQVPYGVAVDSGGVVYISDQYDSRIRRVTASGIITTIAGSGAYGYAGDGGPAPQAEFDGPGSVAVDSGGNVYVADPFNNVIRLLVPSNTQAVLTATCTHAGSPFQPGSTGVYSVVVSNATSAGATTGTVTVTELPPAGLTVVSMAGTGWNCSGSTCTRSDALAAKSSYPPITVTVSVAVGTVSPVLNQVAVSGGGGAATSASDWTFISSSLAAPALVSPANGATGVSTLPTLTWNAVAGAASYDVYFGTLAAPPKVTNTVATSYAPGALTPGAAYYWQIVAISGSGSAASATWSFVTGSGTAGLQFVPVTPCRVVDTRSADGPFGGPTLQAASPRSFAIPQSNCGIPASAQAYSLNVTVVPEGPLSYLTLWPAGQSQPLVSTLNSFAGNVVANAAIVPAGAGGAVSVFVTNPTDVILDINGYFDSAAGANSYSFYPATPCRIADTRNATGLFGGPTMYPQQSRDFPIPSSPCAIPATAKAYSLNVTVVPDPGSHYLGYLSTWPTGQSQPVVSTLNSWTGKIVANAAIVPAGSNGSISVFVTDRTDVVLDNNGYFAAPGSPGALSFYPVAPCRVVDTRNPNGPFGGPELEAGTSRQFTVPASACYVPPTAAAYSLNVTVVPDGVLSYLTTWPTGVTQPFVSTLNSLDGSVVANAAIVPAGTGGAISVFVTNRSHVILDINGYFAP